MKKGTGSLMTTTTPPIVTCPVCGADGSLLHHDVRSSLVYSCLKCTHEWQVDRLVATTADLQGKCAEVDSDGDATAVDSDGDSTTSAHSLIRGADHEDDRSADRSSAHRSRRH